MHALLLAKCILPGLLQHYHPTSEQHPLPRLHPLRKQVFYDDPLIKRSLKASSGLRLSNTKYLLKSTSSNSIDKGTEGFSASRWGEQIPKRFLVSVHSRSHKMGTKHVKQSPPLHTPPSLSIHNLSRDQWLTLLIPRGCFLSCNLKIAF